MSDRVSEAEYLINVGQPDDVLYCRDPGQTNHRKNYPHGTTSNSAELTKLNLLQGFNAKIYFQ